MPGQPESSGRLQVFLTALLGAFVLVEWSGLLHYLVPGISIFILCLGILFSKSDQTWTGRGLKLFSGAFAAGALLYFLILAIFDRPVAYFIRMFTYPDQHPFSYITLMALSYSLLGVLWMQNKSLQPEGRKRWLALFSVVALSILAAAPFGGLLWVLHDWQAGFVPHLARAKEALLWGCQTALVAGPILFLSSQPLSGLSIIFGVLWLDKTQRNR